LSKRQKLIEKIKRGKRISFKEAENLLLYLGFSPRSAGSHVSFTKLDYPKTITLVRSSELLSYQIHLLQEVLSYEEDKD
jgi:predicted RNA binding protein YcfA (HicA-like mRNA interferase family)